jgi:hypothetical protein
MNGAPLQKPPIELMRAIRASEAALTIQELSEKYGDLGHPKNSLSLHAWRFATVNDTTRLGYWEWVQAEIRRVLREEEEARKPNLERVAIALRISNLPAFLTGCADGKEQGFELTMGLSYEDEIDQWCYDTGTHLGACLAVHPDYKGDAMKK